MKIAVVGSRGYRKLENVRKLVRSFPKDTVLISGGARGVDRTAEDEARKLGLKVIVHVALWHKYGKAAGPIRNKLIVDDAEMMHAFWDGKSPGTRNAIDQAAKKGIPVVHFQKIEAIG